MSTDTKRSLFSGVATALITPFKNIAVDLSTWRRLIEFQLRAKVSALVVAGTTGEAPTLSEQERDTLLAEAAKTVNGKVPLIMGCGSNDTAHAISYAKHAENIGADAILVVTPYYNKGTREGLRTHFLCIAEAVDIPIILYNVPSRTGVDLSREDYAVLCEHPNICGIKEASPDITKMAWLCRNLKGKAAIYTGNDAMLLPSLALGANGVISVASNPLPGRMSKICRLFGEGNVADARSEAEALLPLCELLFQETSPSPVKYVMSLLGFGDGEMRLPLTLPEEGLQRLLQKELTALPFEL